MSPCCCCDASAGCERPYTYDEVARWMLTSEKLSKNRIGDYLGRTDEHAMATIDAFLGHLDFTPFVFDEALRFFLSLFKLPGEAQQIDRIMEKFAAQYTKAHPQTFTAPETAYVLAFSLIMLNTDLHNPQIAPERKMTREQFIKNNRGINAGEDLPVEYLTNIYNEIRDKEIVLQPDAAALKAGSAVTQWEGVLRRQMNVAGASFTSSAVARRGSVPAGVHEKYMFESIADQARSAIAVVFERSVDDSTLEQSDKHYNDLLSKRAELMRQVDQATVRGLQLASRLEKERATYERAKKVVVDARLHAEKKMCPVFNRLRAIRQLQAINFMKHWNGLMLR